MTETKQDEPFRIGLIATDPLRVVGLQTIISEQGGAEVVTVASPGALDASGVSLVLVDAACTDHLFELLETFRRSRPHLRLIVIGLEEDHDYIQKVIGAGAKGYLSHTARENEIRMAIEIVLDGSVWAPRKVLARLLEASAGERRGPLPEPKFTERETQVLELLVAGRPNRDIAEALGIDAATVKAHVGRLMRKMGVENRIALSVQAVNRNLVRK
ncbi:response regulator transcription factor [Edaphobacter sp. 12200R-103]|jgi:DNA-binding NarL/FixJ family response regulator|uniref:response regulator transcription factor n=1 Tax=Edaphobacter sp. 12200R-103 TaxID=2703788 RepID=UPI00138BDE8F|nr:response regulator transcription factor [Edaphobacter sp. 12200R-103]QHS50647.1 response regulator transcription factor [Edaphobacter sp. 12200R-103]